MQMIFDIFEKILKFFSLILTTQLIFEIKSFWIHGMKFLFLIIWWIISKSFRILNYWIIAKVL